MPVARTGRRITIEFPRAVLTAMWDTMGQLIATGTVGRESTLAKARAHISNGLKQDGTRIDLECAAESWDFLLDFARGYCPPAVDVILDGLGRRKPVQTVDPEIARRAAEVRTETAVDPDFWKDAEPRQAGAVVEPEKAKDRLF